MKLRHKIYFLVLPLFIWISPALLYAAPLSLLSHQLELNIDVQGHRLRGIDRLSLASPMVSGEEISFLLGKSLKISNISTDNGEKISFRQGTDDKGNQVVTLPLAVLSAKGIRVEFEGEIFEPVEKSRDLSFVRGDKTSGVIGPEGVYLSSETLWVPSVQNALATFDVSVEINKGYRVVTQGELLSRKEEGERWRSRWKSSVPVDGLALIAGRYFVRSQEIDGIQIATYFFEDNEELSGKYIKKCAEYLKFYSGLLGPYPYKRFDVVENFFSSGYGFPYFTLLGSGVIQRGEEAFRPGYLDHEIVHSWWGNFVYNDFGKGNWVEALTTYCANYYYKEEKEGEEAAARHRRQASVAYSLEVPPDREYPLKKFRGKAEERDGEIGYGKGSMVFHQLRRTVGDGVFWNSLRELGRRFGGRYAEWEDLRALFEEKSGKNLETFFSQWVERKGCPRLGLERVQVVPTGTGYRIGGEVVQEGEIYQAELPLVVDLGYGRERSFSVVLREQNNPFSFELTELPVAIRLDPAFHLFRTLGKEEIPPNLNATLSDPGKVFFISDKEETCAQIYKALAEAALEKTGGRIAEGKESLSDILSAQSVFILGRSIFELPEAKGILGALPENIKIGKDEFEVDGKKYQGPEYSLLISVKNPLDAGKTITLYYGQSAQALERAKYIFYYKKDGYLVYKNGKPVSRGDIHVDSPRSFFNVPDSLSGGINSENLMSHVEALASKEMEGRLAGSPGAEKALHYIEEELRNKGLAPERQVFNVHLQGKNIEKLRLAAPEGDKETANLHALIEGSHPEMAKEVVILGAHYDHLGKDIDGNVFQGADDNASGVAALLEIAGELVKAKDRLQRSVLFIFFSGEEWGSMGAGYFVRNPPRPGLKKVAMLNMDSIGRGTPGQYYFIGESYYPSLYNVARKFSGLLGLREGKNIDPHAYVEGSDHYPFHLAGIPAVDFYSSNYREMNSLKDTVSEMDAKKLSQVSKLIHATAFQLLTDPVELKSVKFSGEKHFSSIKQLTFGGENAEAYFSSDGKNLIFQSSRDGRKCDQIYTMTTEGKEVRMVSTGKGATTCSYFLGEGSGIVYASTHLGAPDCPPKPDPSQGYVWPLYKDYDIFRAEADGSRVARLTSTEGYDAEATVSPDGKRIVFTSVRDGDLDLYTMDVDGGNVVRVTEEAGYDGGAFFSPDSRKIVYRANRPKDPTAMREYKDLLARGLVRPGRLEIFIMDADGTNKRQVTNNGAANFCPFMHPDGKRIIFSSNMDDPKGRDFELYMINVDGTGLERLTYNPSFDGFPMFSPDGKKMVFGSNRNNRERGETNIFIVDWVE